MNHSVIRAHQASQPCIKSRTTESTECSCNQTCETFITASTSLASTRHEAITALLERCSFSFQKTPTRRNWKKRWRNICDCRTSISAELISMPTLWLLIWKLTTLMSAQVMTRTTTVLIIRTASICWELTRAAAWKASPMSQKIRFIQVEFVFPSERVVRRVIITEHAWLNPMSTLRVNASNGTLARAVKSTWNVSQPNHQLCNVLKFILFSASLWTCRYWNDTVHAADDLPHRHVCEEEASQSKRHRANDEHHPKTYQWISSSQCKLASR